MLALPIRPWLLGAHRLVRPLGPVVGAVALGVAAEALAFDVSEWQLWVFDLLTGWGLLGSAMWLAASGRASATAWLLAATGVCWFLGSIPGALYLHRGPLVHLLLSFPVWRPGARRDAAFVVAGYAAALYEPVWADDGATLVLALGLVALGAWRMHAARPEDRGDRRAAAWSAVALACVLGVVVVSTRAVPDGSLVVPMLIVYESTIVTIAVVLARRARGASRAAIQDMVVELSAPPRARLQEDLRQVLRDPRLTLGYWSPELHAYVGVDGQKVDLGGLAEDRAVMPADGGRPPAAVLVHSRQALTDPEVDEAVAAAVRRSSLHRELHRALATQRRELTASRQRLLVVADEERARLDQQLHGGPEKLLDELQAVLDGLTEATSRGAATNEHVARAESHVTLLRDLLRDLSAGLMPRELASGGLGAALRALSDRLPVPVTVHVQVGDVPAEIARAAYFICSEALTNASKHASASKVVVGVRQADGWLTVEVSDDGVGGVLTGGSGVAGLVDRARALGGSVQWTSTREGGTTMVATLPLDQRPQTREPT